MFSLCVKAGGNINVPGMFKETPLHDAARNGHYKVGFICKGIIISFKVVSNVSREYYIGERSRPAICYHSLKRLLIYVKKFNF